MPYAESPKYTALYDVESGVRFQHGRAEVSDEQARLLAKRRFVDGILIDGVSAKKWTPADSDSDRSEPAPADAPPLPESTPAAAPTGTNRRSK
jgi:hypothetical protein